MSDERPSLRDLRDRARGPRRTVTTFGPDPDADLESVLEQYDVALDHQFLPVPPAAGFLVVRAEGRYLGSIPAAAFAELRDPNRGAPWDAATRESAFRELASLLTGTSFETDDRGRLLATTREIEDRAWRVGRGRLVAAFQSLSAFRDQVPVYGRLAAETDLDVVVFGAPDWEPPALPGVRFRDATGELREFWIVAFDGGDEDAQACALVAEEGDPGEFTGVLTYDAAVVSDLLARIEAISE